MERMLGRLLRWVGWGLMLSLASSAWAQPAGGADGWERVGRIADTLGTVWVYDDEEGDWTRALRNRPIVSGDRLSTGGDGRVEVRIGSTTLRLAARTELELVRLDERRVELHLHSGRAALRVRTQEAADDTLVATREARLRPLRPGHYRFDREDEVTSAAALSGELLLDGPTSFPIAAGTRMDFWLDRGRGLQHRWAAMPADDLSAWVAQEDQQELRSASAGYVSPEMTGAEDLDRYGRWDRHPEYGAVWIPLSVAVDWAPYRSGHWTWIRPWGWTWVDAQPWGFAPFHYGRWAHWRGRWCWVPGSYTARPRYSPGLVAWIGEPGVSVGVTHGRRPLPGTSWVPLAPRDPYVGHAERRPPGPERSANWGNQRIPGAVTPLTPDVFTPRTGRPPVVTAPAPSDHTAGRREPPPPGPGRAVPVEPAPPPRIMPTAPVAPVAPPPITAAPVPATPPAPPPRGGIGSPPASHRAASPPAPAAAPPSRSAPESAGAPRAPHAPQPPAPPRAEPGARAAPPAGERRAAPRSDRPAEARESRDRDSRGGSRERAAQP